MSDPTPVPLDETEAAHAWDRLDPDEPRCRRCDLPFPCPPVALCEALRIAVEGLGRIGEPSCPEMRLSPVERLETAGDALAAVRELVDLGGDDG